MTVHRNWTDMSSTVCKDIVKNIRQPSIAQKTNVPYNKDTEMEQLVQKLKDRLNNTVAHLKKELMGVRGNRPTPQLIENIQVEYFEELLPLKQVGTIGIVPPRELNVTVWDAHAVDKVAAAIEKAPVNLNPQIDGNTIRMNVPALTDERRTELTKLVRSIIEKVRIRIRSERDDINKKIDHAFSEKEIDEDQKFKSKKKVQEQVDEANKKTEELLNDKIQEFNE